MWINYHHLFYFKTIAEEKSVSRAAEKLRLGQPTLSAQLKQFESYLGVKLFDRQHKKLQLTEQGLIVLNYAQAIFKMGSEMVDTLNDRSIPEKIKLQIGSLDAIPKEFIVDLISKKLNTLNVQISFIEGDLNLLLRELDLHRIDLILTNYLPHLKSQEKLNHHVLSKNEVKIFGAAEFKTLKKKFPESLHYQKMILPNYESQLRADLDHWIGLRKLDIDVVVESQDMALKKQFAIQGFGLLAASEVSMGRELKENLIYEIGTLKNVFETIFMISAERKVVNPALAALLK